MLINSSHGRKDYSLRKKKPKYLNFKNIKKSNLQEISFLNTCKNKLKTNNRLLLLKLISIIIVINIYVYIYIYIRNNVCNNSTYCIKESLHNNTKTTLEKINTIILVTNNNENYYRGMKNCLLNNPDKQLCFYHLISPKKVEGKKRILIGEKRDGSYVLLDDFQDIKIAYSFGISVKIQFDIELANRGIDVYMYDHTIDRLPRQNPRFHWKKIGIKGKNEINPQLKTLEKLMVENGHTKEENMIFKIDVEGAEWDSINDLQDNILTQFKYIVIEYHFTEISKLELYYNVLKKVSKNHQPFYLRCHGRDDIITIGNNRICVYLEVSYVIKKNHSFAQDDTMYPIFEFDHSGPINSEKQKINLNLLKLFNDN